MTAITVLVHRLVDYTRHRSLNLWGRSCIDRDGMLCIISKVEIFGGIFCLHGLLKTEMRKWWKYYSREERSTPTTQIYMSKCNSHMLLRMNTRERWKYCSREDVDQDKPENTGRTPLSFAAWKGHEAVVKILLSSRITPTSQIIADKHRSFLPVGEYVRESRKWCLSGIRLTSQAGSLRQKHCSRLPL